MLEVLGLLGGLGFAVSGIPTAINAIKQGKVEFIPKLTQWSVFIGALLMVIYLVARNGFDWIVILDYGITITSWGIVLKYEYYPRV